MKLLRLSLNTKALRIHGLTRWPAAGPQLIVTFCDWSQRHRRRNSACARHDWLEKGIIP
jgi:hypothetical protein